jgi:hypothetical protein
MMSDGILARSLAKRGVNLVRLHDRLGTRTLAKFRRVLKNGSLPLSMHEAGGHLYLLVGLFSALLQLQSSNGFAGYMGQNPFALLSSIESFSSFIMDGGDRS